MANTIKYLNVEKAKLYKDSNSNTELMELLWGDRVELVSNTKVNGRYKVNARWANNAYIDADVLGDTSLLELYFIDVGQGDGVLIVTPDRKHILIDGGYKRSKQPHGKSAADFVDWKFKKEYKQNTIELDAMICSHCDADHYGGLWDLINPDEREKKELDTTKTNVKNFYHAGISWWKNAEKSRFLGTEKDGAMYDLLTGKTSIKNGLKASASLKLQGEWANFLNCIVETDAKIERLSYNPKKNFDYLPGFEANQPTSIKVLGPIETTIDGQATLKDLGTYDKNTNGNSVLLRVDYGRSRILLTGDLNKKSQRHIIESLSGNKIELAADVVKACHHGSDDCSYEFLQYVNAAATVISSGDDETHAHPRPNIVAASGVTGFQKIENDEMVTPLIYSTEISRSLKIGDPYEVNSKDYDTADGKIDVLLTNEAKTNIRYKHTSSGALNPTDKSKTMNRLKVVDGIVYGLVNVRTDGHKILCATLNEGKSKWEIKTFYSRF
ncbi:ComEC/Rec2 family competence protein [Aquaticitalea lipolytica]|nr:MBL fold metallo-hydrolase [Aquaticitalea lipolytica]